VEKSSAIFGYFANKEKLPKVKNRTIGEKSPNLVTLAAVIDPSRHFKYYIGAILSLGIFANTFWNFKTFCQRSVKVFCRLDYIRTIQD
jgi:hypothetical protein